MTMTMPGLHRPLVAAPASAVTKRAGLIRMAADSGHQLLISVGKDQPLIPAYCFARDKRDAAGAKTVHVCMNPGCRGKSWPDFAAMASAHPERGVMTAQAAAHVYGLWSQDPVDPKDASKGVIGLIAPPEPHVEE